MREIKVWIEQAPDGWWLVKSNMSGFDWCEAARMTRWGARRVARRMSRRIASGLRREDFSIDVPRLADAAGNR